MHSKEFIRKRIATFFGEEDVDPCMDKEVTALLKSHLSIYLPQRSSFDDSLSSTTSDHEVLQLIIQYRSLEKESEFLHKANDGLSPPPPYVQY